jgi:drug/metabolite transporter (DMT)-like permease
MGLAGTVIVLHGRTISGQAGWGWLATCIALISITLGTLYQKRYCSQIDWRPGNFIQFLSAALLFAIGAWLFETRVIVWNHAFVFGLAWLVVVLSIGSIGLLYWLIRHSAATQFASLFYLVPGVTAIMAYVLFDERLDLLSIIGMVICAAAVLLVNKNTAPARSA